MGAEESPERTITQALLVDTDRPQKLLLMSGPVGIIEKGKGYRRLSKLFYSELTWVKRDPWKESIMFSLSDQALLQNEVGASGV